MDLEDCLALAMVIKEAEIKQNTVKKCLIDSRCLVHR